MSAFRGIRLRLFARAITVLPGLLLAGATVSKRVHAQAMRMAGYSDSSVIAAALDHVANRAPGHVLYLDPRKLNPEQRSGPQQWLDDWEPDLIRALRLDYRLIAGTVMTNGAQSCRPTTSVMNSTPSIGSSPSRGPALLKPNDSPIMGNTQPTTLYVAASSPSIAEDSAHVYVATCDNGRLAERVLTMVRLPKKWKVVQDVVQKRN